MASRERRHPDFYQDALVVVEIVKRVNQFSSLPEYGNLLAVNVLCLENEEEIFRHGVVIAVPPLDIESVILYSCC